MRGNPLSCEISKLGPPMVLHGSKKGSSWARVTRGDGFTLSGPIKGPLNAARSNSTKQEPARLQRHQSMSNQIPSYLFGSAGCGSVVLLPSKQRTFSLISNLLAPNDALQAAGLKGRWQGEEVSLDGTNSSL
ncbi:hypothetical protein NQZ68_032982 [Dissostichus eleginoides]|nr:hypothetical protein NQZ68_032982 [Dissostichus eleginoides]